MIAEQKTYVPNHEKVSGLKETSHCGRRSKKLFVRSRDFDPIRESF
jgi:hypothetical protein